MSLLGRIGEFLTPIGRSFFDPTFYRHVRTETLTPVVKLFAFLGTLGIALTMGSVLFAALPFAFSSFPDQLEAVFPNDLIVTIASGSVAINKPQPYYIPVPASMPSFATSSSSVVPKFLVIFDASNTLSSDTIENSTYVILKKDYAVSGTGNDQRFTSFEHATGTTAITKKDISGIIDPLKSYFKPVVIIGSALAFVLALIFGTITWVMFHMLYLLFPALIIFFIAHMRPKPVMYKEAYMIAAYASIPVAILAYVSGFFIDAWPVFVYSFLVFFMGFVNLAREESPSVTLTTDI